MGKKISQLGLVISILALTMAILSAINFYFFGGSNSHDPFHFMGNAYPIIPALFAVWYFSYNLREE